MFSPLLIVLCHKIPQRLKKQIFYKAVRQNPKWKACVWDYHYACCIPINMLQSHVLFFFFISGRVLSPTRTQVSRQASCYIGLPLLRELALLTSCMLWLCDMTKGLWTCSMQLFKLCQLVKVPVRLVAKASCAMVKHFISWVSSSHDQHGIHDQHGSSHDQHGSSHVTNTVAHMWPTR